MEQKLVVLCPVCQLKRIGWALQHKNGATENAGVENAGASKMKGGSRELTRGTRMRGGNRGNGNRGTRMQGWKSREKRVWKAKLPFLYHCCRVEHWISLPNRTANRTNVIQNDITHLYILCAECFMLLNTHLNVRVNLLVSCQTLHSKSTHCVKRASIITRFSVNIVRTYIFKTFAFRTFPSAISTPAISTPAIWCRDFHSHVFHCRDFTIKINLDENVKKMRLQFVFKTVGSVDGKSR